jgi:hypothetical protein
MQLLCSWPAPLIAEWLTDAAANATPSDGVPKKEEYEEQKQRIYAAIDAITTVTHGLDTLWYVSGRLPESTPLVAASARLRAVGVPVGARKWSQSAAIHSECLFYEKGFRESRIHQVSGANAAQAN